MNILFDHRWVGAHGIGRFAAEISNHIKGMEYLPQGPEPLDLIDNVWLGMTIQKLNPDIFLSPGFNPPAFCKVPFVFTIHDLIHLKIPEENSFIKQVYFNYIVRPACHKAAHVLTVSEFSRREIAEWASLSPKKITNVGCGVAESFNPEGPVFSLEKPYLLYVGNHKPHKNLPGLLKAFSRSETHKKMKLLMTGHASQELMKVIRDLGLSSAVEFIGVIPDVDLSRYYRGAIALVIPSLYEGFGLPALEAMACGTPVIASNVTSLPEVVADAALLFEPTDTDMLSEVIKRVAIDQPMCEEFSRRGLIRSNHFNWQTVSKKILETLQLVCH